MSNCGLPKILLRAANDTLRVYAASAVLSLLLINFILPSWIRWLWFTVTASMFLVGIVANFVENWIPKSRVPVNSKAVVITGCDSGFGQNLAQKLDDLGLQVFAGCLNPDDEGAKSLKKHASEKLQVLPLDVTSEESVEKFHKQVMKKIKDNILWAVVCNAGINDGGDIFWTNFDTIQRVMDVNTFGVVRVTKAFLPQLCKVKGRVITVVSTAGLYSFGGIVPYCMSKHAAKSFCDGLRLEMYRFGVKVVTIEPFPYKTNILKEDSILKCYTKTWEKAPNEIKEFYPEDYLQWYKKNAIKFLNYGSSDKLQQVIDCLEEAVMALNPKYSYNPGNVLTRFLFCIVMRLPKQFADIFLCEQFRKIF